MEGFSLDGLNACAVENWSPKIGDPSVMGWVTVAVYFIASVVAFSTATRAGFPTVSRWRERLFWTCLGIILFALAINKELDLQSYMTAFGRCMAKLQGWYGSRHAIQRIAILLLIASMVGVFVLVARMLRGTLQRNYLALVGIVFVLAFVAIRAMSFHHFDILIRTEFNHLRLNWLLELPGPLLIIANGLLLQRVLRVRAS